MIECARKKGAAARNHSTARFLDQSKCVVIHRHRDDFGVDTAALTQPRNVDLWVKKVMFSAIEPVSRWSGHRGDQGSDGQV